MQHCRLLVLKLIYDLPYPNLFSQFTGKGETRGFNGNGIIQSKDCLSLTHELGERGYYTLITWSYLTVLSHGSIQSSLYMWASKRFTQINRLLYTFNVDNGIREILVLKITSSNNLLGINTLKSFLNKININLSGYIRFTIHRYNIIVWKV